MNGMSAFYTMHRFLTYCMCYFLSVFRSLSFLVKLEQLDLGSNELEVLVYQKSVFTPVMYNLLYFIILLSLTQHPCAAQMQLILQFTCITNILLL